MSKEDTVIYIADVYHKTLRKHNFFPEFNQELAFYEKVSKACIDHKPWEKYILMIETCYLALIKEERMIIKYDYFYKNNSYWWEQSCYSNKRDYLKAREDAVLNFYSNLRKIKVIKENGEINVALFR